MIDQKTSGRSGLTWPRYVRYILLLALLFYAGFINETLKHEISPWHRIAVLGVFMLGARTISYAAEGLMRRYYKRRHEM